MALRPKHLCDKKRVLFLFLRKEIALPAAMSRGDFKTKHLKYKREIPFHNLSVPHWRDKCLVTFFILFCFFFKGIQACSAGFLDEKVTKESRLPNLCSFHRGKSLERNPSRVNGSAITEFLQHFCGLLMSVGQQRKCKKIYRAPIQTFRGRICWGGSAVSFAKLP